MASSSEVSNRSAVAGTLQWPFTEQLAGFAPGGNGSTALGPGRSAQPGAGAEAAERRAPLDPDLHYLWPAGEVPAALQAAGEAEELEPCPGLEDPSGLTGVVAFAFNRWPDSFLWRGGATAETPRLSPSVCSARPAAPACPERLKFGRGVPGCRAAPPGREGVLPDHPGAAHRRGRGGRAGRRLLRPAVARGRGDR